MPDNYTRMKEKLELKISQLEIELNLKKLRINQLKKESNRKTDTILRLNNIIQDLKRSRVNLPTAIPIN